MSNLRRQHLLPVRRHLLPSRQVHLPARLDNVLFDQPGTRSHSRIDRPSVLARVAVRALRHQHRLRICSHIGTLQQRVDLEHNVCDDATNHWNALTDGQWKYISRTNDDEEQLFQLEKDRHEVNDLAKRPEAAEELAVWRARMVGHLQELVRDGKLMLRKQGTAPSPNFPGYVLSEKINA